MKIARRKKTKIKLTLLFSDSQCKVPKQYWGDFYSIEQGNELNTMISSDELDNGVFRGGCTEIKIDNATYDAAGNHDSKILFHSR